MRELPIKRALVSVTDKTGVVDLCRFLTVHGVEIISTGGTKKMLEEAGLKVYGVESVTGFPEILNGRVKTLHPAIHGGILANKDDAGHLATLAKLDIAPFDLICVNLYEFARAVDAKLPPEKIIEEIDIGGPCLLRAAAKNFSSILPLPSPRYYQEARSALEQNGMKAPLDLRHKMAAAAFAITAKYDAAIAGWLKAAF